MRGAGVERIETERTGDKLSVIIHSSRPGIIIGRAGSGVEDLNKQIEKILRKVRGNKKDALPQFRLEVREIRNPETFASLVGLSIAEQIEKRMPFRRVMKQSIDRIMKAGASGVKVIVSGRLNGAEIANSETLFWGKLPLHTLRAHIDFSRGVARTVAGAIGVKVWVYTGDVFNEKERRTKE